MSTAKTAILINVTGIQEYIFSSNKLKENIGASYIIEKKIYVEVLKEALEYVLNIEIDINAWKDEKNVLDSDYPIGFIGGGNTLLFFKHIDEAKLFIKNFSTEVLIKFPGLHLAFGVKENFDVEDNYKDHFNDLMVDLKERKSKYVPIVNIPKHGITADCPWSNDCAEVEILGNNNKAYISMGSFAKIEASKIAQNENRDSYGIEDKYTLTTNIEKLGQENQSSYIAVVHIDGNGMGKIFGNIKLLTDLRKKSAAVSRKANNAMSALIKEICGLIVPDNKNEYYIGDIHLNKDDNEKDNQGNKKIILPIRPILVGGDDITFICEGRLGIYLAERFIDLFYDKTERNKSDLKDKLMTGACAGIAIVKTHFPFYKAVQLAEELCAEAKKPTRKAEKGCYISWYYSATTFSGTLGQLRQRTHSSFTEVEADENTGIIKETGISMYYGPYRLFADEDNSFQSNWPDEIEKLKKGIACFKNQENSENIKKWPKNKIMELREIIADNASSQKLFEKEIEVAGLQLPDGQNKTWVTNLIEEDEGVNEQIKKWEKRTPFFDQIELMDFYPNHLLNSGKNENNS